jgi:sugar/nucleoside kinase (ribokinase family)
MYDALVAGHLCVDITPVIDAATAQSAVFLAPGRLTEVGEAIFSTGGAVSNTGQALYKLGLSVRLAARVGDDAIADLIRTILGRYNPEFSAMPTVGRGEPSSYTVVIAPPTFDRTFLHCPGTNKTFGPEDIDDTLLAQTRLFHLGYPPLLQRMYADSGIELASIFRRAKIQGATTALDMSLPDPNKPSGQADWRLICERVLPSVDIFLPSVEELLFMLHRARYLELVASVGQGGMIDALTVDDISSLADQALALGTRVLVLKLGHRGLYVRSVDQLRNLGRATPDSPAGWQGRQLWAPCFKAQVVSTAGSGDATIAGFLAGMVKGQTITEAATSAVAVGACNVEAMDTISGVRSWEETQARITSGWVKLETRAPGMDWRWNDLAKLWYGPLDKGCD